MDPNKPDSIYRGWLVRSRSTRNLANARLLSSYVTGDSRSTRQTASGARTDREPRANRWSKCPSSVRVYTEQRPIRLWLGASTIRTFRTLRRCMNGSIAPTPRHFLSPTHDYVYSTLFYSILFYSVLFSSVLFCSLLFSFPPLFLFIVIIVISGANS